MSLLSHEGGISKAITRKITKFVPKHNNTRNRNNQS